MPNILLATVHVEIDRDTGDVKWRTEGVDTGTPDSQLLFQALSWILHVSAGGDPPKESVH